MNPSSILDDVTNNFQSRPQQKKRYKTTSTFNDNQVTAVSQHTLDAQTRTLQSKHQLEYQQKYDEVEETLLSNDLSKIERTNTLISDIQEGIGKLQLEAEAKQASIEESMRVKLLRPVFQFNGETLQSALIMEAAFENEKYRVAAQVKNIAAKESSLKSRLETILARERDVKSKMELIKEDERKTVTSLERRQATITEQESSLKSRSSNLTQREEMLNQFKEELDKRESNINKQETTLTEREATLDTQGLRLQSRSEVLDERQSNITEQETTLAERKATLDTHESKLTEFRSSLVECKEKLERDQRAVKEQTDELSRSKTALDERQSALNERQLRVSEQELRVTQHKEEIERVKTANDQRAEELEQSKTTLEQSKTTLKQDQAVLCQHQSRIKEQETQLKSQLDVLSRDKTALDEREVTVVQREAHLKSQSDKLAIDTDELAKLKAELDKRQSTLTEQESRLKDHRDEEIENQQEYKYVADDLSLPKEKFNEVYKSHFGFDASAEVHQKIEELQNYEYDKLDYENEPMLVRKKVHELVVTRGSDIHNSRVKKLLRKHALKAINLVRDEGKDFSEDCEWLNSAGKINIGESAVCRIMAIPSIGFFIIYQQNQINKNYGMSTLQNDAGLLDNDHRQPMDSLMHYVHKSGEACVKSMMNYSNYIPMWAIINQKVKSSKTLVLTERVESSTGELIEHAILPHNSESVNASIQRFHVKHVLHLLENAEKGMPTLLTDRACALLSSEGYDIKEMYATEYNSEEDASMEGGNDSDPDFDPNGNGGFEQEEESDGSEPMSLVDEDEIMSFGTTDGSLPPMNQSRSRRRPSKHSHNDSDSDELSSDRGPFRARPAKKISKKQLQLELDNSSDSDSSDSDVPIKKKKAATKPKKTKPKKAKLKKPESELSSSESSDSETKKKKKKKKQKQKIDNNTKTNSKKVKSKSKEKLGKWHQV